MNNIYEDDISLTKPIANSNINAYVNTYDNTYENEFSKKTDSKILLETIKQQHNLLEIQSEQMLALVDIINVYEKESKELKNKCDVNSYNINKNTFDFSDNNTHNEMNNVHIYIIVFVFLLCIAWYYKKI